jgi:hypothetical protein
MLVIIAPQYSNTTFIEGVTDLDSECTRAKSEGTPLSKAGRLGNLPIAV